MALPSELTSIKIVRSVTSQSNGGWSVDIDTPKSWLQVSNRANMASAHVVEFTCAWYGSHGTFLLQVKPSELKKTTQLISTIMIAESDLVTTEER